jgi:hypothetical protein
MEPLHKPVFRHQIWDYFVNDIEACFRSAHYAQQFSGNGGQNFTAATVIFTVIDFCAGFYHGKVGSELNLTTKEVTLFMQKYLGRENSMFCDINFCSYFYRVFRHVLIHTMSECATIFSNSESGFTGI